MKQIGQNNGKKGLKFEQILGINVTSSSLNEVLTRVTELLSHNLPFFILTPNPELVLLAQDNPKLKTALNHANFAIPDGNGLKYASKYLYGKNLNIIHGRKMFDELNKEANLKHWKVFLLGGVGLEAQKAAEKLKFTYKNIRIESSAGPHLGKQATPSTDSDKELEKRVIKRINKFAPQMLFVAFGNPKQEIWIYKNLSKLKVGGAMAVGGTFRYVAGISKLPPKWMERASLEWIYRLITEPYRAGRVFNAAIVFPLKIFWYKLFASVRS